MKNLPYSETVYGRQDHPKFPGLSRAYVIWIFKIIMAKCSEAGDLVCDNDPGYTIGEFVTIEEAALNQAAEIEEKHQFDKKPRRPITPLQITISGLQDPQIEL